MVITLCRPREPFWILKVCCGMRWVSASDTVRLVFEIKTFLRSLYPSDPKTVPKLYLTYTLGLFHSYVSDMSIKWCLDLRNKSPKYCQYQGHNSLIWIWDTWKSSEHFFSPLDSKYLGDVLLIQTFLLCKHWSISPPRFISPPFPPLSPASFWTLPPLPLGSTTNNWVIRSLAFLDMASPPHSRHLLVLSCHDLLLQSLCIAVSEWLGAT